MKPITTLFNVKPLFANITGTLQLHQGFLRSVLEECMQQQVANEHVQPSCQVSTPRDHNSNAKPVEQFFIGSPNKRASLHTDKCPSSPRTVILKGPSGSLNAKGRERSRRRMYAQHQHAAELNARHEKEMREFRLRLEESTRCCRDLRPHLEREADHIERKERTYRRGLELRKAREEKELKLCTFKPAKAKPVPASNKPLTPKTKERRPCRQPEGKIRIPGRPKIPKTERSLEESTTDESNTSSVATICWVRPTLSFTASNSHSA